MPRSALLATLLLAAAGAPVLADEGAPSSAVQNARRTPIVEAVEKAAPAVVSVGTTKLVKVRYFDYEFSPRTGTQEQHGLGSGAIVHPSGYVVTNAHVINQADEILVKLTGAREKEPEIPATLIAVDVKHDLALLRLEKPGPYPYVEFGKSSDLMIGETVIAIGNPFGLGRTVSSGIVSALDRSLQMRDSKFTGFIQTDAAVNQGNSGGPLLNILGEWIGVNSAIYSLSGGADGISFAIPVDTVRKFVIDSIGTARFAGVWLGLDFAAHSDGDVVVERVHPYGPAAKAGLAAGARLAGRRDPLRFCFDLLDAQKRGSFTFDVREETGRARPVTLKFEAPPIEDITWRRLGLKCVEVDEGLAARTRYPIGSGLVVLEIKAGGPADRIGLARGDLIQSLGASRLAGSGDLFNAMIAVEKGDTRDIELVRPAYGSGESLKARIAVE